MKKKSWSDYMFTLVIGSIYLYALVRTIFGATFIQLPQSVLLTMSIAAVGILLAVFYNKRNFFISFGLLTLFGLLTANSIRMADPRYAHPWVVHFTAVVDMLGGLIPYDSHLGHTVAWAVIMVLGFLVMIFMHLKFNFVALATVGVGVFVLAWGPGFVRDNTGFLLFLFVFCVMLVRRMNFSATRALRVAPMFAALIFMLNTQMPAESPVFVRRQITASAGGVMESLGDFMFELFNPTYFTFQSTGFGGSGGRLGGPVTPNNRTVMEVLAPGGTYLAGARSNYYAGDRWIATIEEGDIYTHGLPPAQFEMLENAVALIRGATIANARSNISLTPFFEYITPADYRQLELRDIATVAVVANMGYYLHTYLPLSNVTVNMGRQRTGTVFAPVGAWDIGFNPPGHNYLPYLTMYTVGDIHAPELMRRGTSYYMEFLDIDTSLSFVEHILRGAGAGVYDSFREPLRWQRAQFAGQYVGMLGYEAWWTQDPRDSFYSAIDAQLVRTHDVMHHVAEGRDVRMLGDINRDEFFIHVPGDILWPDADDMPYALFFPLEQYYLPEFYPIDYFMSLNQFVAEDMVVLVEHILSLDDPGNINAIPRESYLISWLDNFAVSTLYYYAQEVRAHFTQVPEIVPQRVHDLTHGVVMGLDNDFDRVMAIRDFLLQFPYTLTPEPVPRGVCFVDHFLFVGQEGYCTYFASAMAMMARIAGVPSRYVEGFVLPPSPTSTPEWQTVTNRMAHAWVEVYLEGFGWMTVEATPTYAFLQDPTIPLPATGGAASQGFDSDWFMYMAGRMGGDPEIDMFNEMEMFMANQNNRQPAAGQTQETGEETVVAYTQGINPNVLFLIIVGLMVVGVVVYKYIHYRLHYKAMTNGEKVIKYFNALLDVVGFYTVPINPGETPKDYAAHKGKRFAFRSDTIFLKDLIGLYYRARYSCHTITDDEVELMKEAYFDMMKLVKNNRLPVVVMYMRYVRRVGVV